MISLYNLSIGATAMKIVTVSQLEKELVELYSMADISRKPMYLFYASKRRSFIEKIEVTHNSDFVIGSNILEGFNCLSWKDSKGKFHCVGLEDLNIFSTENVVSRVNNDWYMFTKLDEAEQYLKGYTTFTKDTLYRWNRKSDEYKSGDKSVYKCLLKTNNEGIFIKVNDPTCKYHVIQVSKLNDKSFVEKEDFFLS